MGLVARDILLEMEDEMLDLEELEGGPGVGGEKRDCLCCKPSPCNRFSSILGPGFYFLHHLFFNTATH